MVVLAPFDDVMRDQVLPRRARHARKIHAPVLLEVLAFGGEDRVLENLGVLLVGEEHQPLQGEIADRLAVVGVKSSVTTSGLKILEGADLRQIA